MTYLNTNYSPYIQNPNIIGEYSTNMNNRQSPEVQLPNMYYIPENYQRPATFKENVKKWDVMGLVYQWLEHPLLMLGTCFGISLGVDAFDRSCNKEYEKSILGRAAKFGDKIERSKILQNDNSQKILGGIKNGCKKIKDFAFKSSVIKSMFETPTKPEWSMPKESMLTSEQRIVTKFREIAGAINLNPIINSNGTEEFKELSLKDFDLTKEELSNLKNIYGENLKKAPKGEIGNRIILSKLGKTEAEITSILSSPNPSKAVSEALRKASGLEPEELARLCGTGELSKADLKLIEQASHNLRNVKVKTGNIKAIKSINAFSNTTGLGEVYNRLHSIRGGAETSTGKFMSKLLQYVHRGFTFGGTKFGVMLFVAPLLVETMVNTKKADKKEKVGTAVQGLVNAVSWVFTFPLILKGIHALGGMQYAGMGKDKVKELEKLINEHNAKKTRTKSEVKELKKQIKELRKVENQNLLTKMLRGISKFTKADLMKIKPANDGNAFVNFIRKIPNFLKDAAYSPARFLVFMFVGMPFVDKIIEKCTSSLFGKSYDSMKFDERAENKKKQEEFAINDLRSQMLEVEKNKLATPNINNTSASINTAPVNTTQNIIEEEKTDINTTTEPQNNNNQNANVIANVVANDVEKSVVDKKNYDSYTYIPSSTNVLNNKTSNTSAPEKYIPSSENILNDVKMNEQYNKYIPSQQSSKFTKTYNNSGLESALKRAQRAEERAVNVLAGNFGSLS